MTDGPTPAHPAPDSGAGDAAGAPDQRPDQHPDGRQGRPADPERGLRGALSATLVLEALSVLLAIPVARNTGNGTGVAGIIAIVALAFALIGACMFVGRPWFAYLVGGLQALTIAGWFISGPLGVIGVIFAAVFATMFYLRHEFRRRQAAGLLPR